MVNKYGDKSFNQLHSIDSWKFQKYNEIVGFAVMAEWQTRQLEGLVGVSPVEVRVFLAA